MPFSVADFAQVLLVICTVTSACSAQPTIWGLQPGDRFQAEIQVSRRTEIRIGDAVATKSDSIDTLLLRYTAENILPGGDLAVRVSVMDVTRRPGEVSDSPNLTGVQQFTLKHLTVVAVVDVDGVVKGISGWQEALRELTNAGRAETSLLLNAVPEDTFATWIASPFWIPKSVSQIRSDDKWERIHQLSLGWLGQIRTIATCHAKPVTGDSDDTSELASDRSIVEVAITGNCRHVTPQPRTEATQPTFGDFVPEGMTFSGTGILNPAKTAAPPDSSDGDDDTKDSSFEPLLTPIPGINRARPGQSCPLKSLTLSIDCSGTATMTLDDRQTPVHFRHSQQQTTRILSNAVYR
ncbi:MAG: hypothetical protein R3C49_09955 [Planctomycetaceae bacterium]